MSPAKQALLQRLDKVINFDSMMDQMSRGMMPAMMQGMRKANPAITDAQAKDLSDIAIAVMAKYTPRMKARMFEVYAETFSEDELRALVEFYETPNGRAVIQKMPLLMQRFAPMMATLIPEIQADMMTAICAKYDCPTAPAK